MNDIFETGVKPTWCPGCGNYGIWMALKSALTKLAIPHEQIVLVFGVGCHGNMRDWMNVYGVEGLHGRAIPVAQGLKIANPDLHVIAVVGDGDCIGEGGNHFIHAAKRNPNITVMVHNNEVYGLTTGQAAPTARQGMRTKSTPSGVVDPPMNPGTLALLAGATFAARGFAGNIPQLTEIMVQAIGHKGFSVVDVLQPCVTFDKVHTYQWYRERVQNVDVPSEKLGDKAYGMQLAGTWGDTIPVGVFHKRDEITSEEQEIELKNGPLYRYPSYDLSAKGFLSLFQ